MIILKLRVRSVDEWRELAPSQADDLDLAVPGGDVGDGAVVGDAASGTIFVPTTDEVEPAANVIVEVASALLPNKVLIRGTVQSWRPALPRMRVRAGATVVPHPDEAIKLTFLSDVLSGKRTDVPRRRHHRLPVSVAVRYRVANSASFVDSAISEIGVGGALLMTSEALPIDTELTLEVVPPGAVQPIDIASKVSYHVPQSGGSGIKFVTRDGDGDRRLRELIRRLRAS